MHEKLKEYFAKAEEKEKGITAQELINAGLYAKVYSGKSEYLDEYPCGEWDDENKKQKYFKKVPIQLTPEETKKIKKIYHSSQEKPTNSIATGLTVIAWFIFIGGFIAGLFFASIEAGPYEESSFLMAIIFWSVAFVSGLLFLGFAEIIKLLNDIKNK